MPQSKARHVKQHLSSALPAFPTAVVCLSLFLGQSGQGFGVRLYSALIAANDRVRDLQSFINKSNAEGSCTTAGELPSWLHMLTSCSYLPVDSPHWSCVQLGDFCPQPLGSSPQPRLGFPACPLCRPLSRVSCTDSSSLRS